MERCNRQTFAPAAPQHGLAFADHMHHLVAGNCAPSYLALLLARSSHNLDTV
jgi:hypothetical protein